MSRQEVMVEVEGLYTGHVWGLADFLKHKCSHVTEVHRVGTGMLVVMDCMGAAMRLQDYIIDWRRELLPEEPKLSFKLTRGEHDTLFVSITDSGER
jgi:hypothetical protein